jgi:hypothetical protein
MLRLTAAIVTSLALCALRLDLASSVGFSDAEALFVAFRFHPQPAYVDYPGLIGWLARLVDPSAPVIHWVTALAATALPWAGVLAARALGTPWRSALLAYFPLALLPALSIGTFAFTPALPLGYTWLLAIGCSGFALRKPVASFTGLLASVAAGALAALACLSEPSGWALALCLGWVGLARSERQRFLTIAPWAACGVFAILTAPLVTFWWARGFSMGLDPQLGVSHAVTVLLRPILSATPPFVVAGALVARQLLEPRATATADGNPDGASVVERVLRHHLLLPLLPLAVLAVCARTETDWLTPVYLVLSLSITRLPALRRSLVLTCFGTGLGVALLGWCWLRTSAPQITGRWLGGYEPALDASNDFFAWGPGKQLLADAVHAARERTGQTPVVIGPHWSVCAQAEVALGGSVHVGCDSLERDDYDDWSGPALWENAQTLLFVTDSRFHRDAPESLYGRSAIAVHRATVERFGQTVRAISVTEFDREEGTARAASPTP